MQNSYAESPDELYPVEVPHWRWGGANSQMQGSPEPGFGSAFFNDRERGLWSRWVVYVGSRHCAKESSSGLVSCN